MSRLVHFSDSKFLNKKLYKETKLICSTKVLINLQVSWKAIVPQKPKSTSMHFKELSSSSVKNNKNTEVYLSFTQFCNGIIFTLIQVPLRLEAKHSFRTKRGSTPQRKSKDIKVMN